MQKKYMEMHQIKRGNKNPQKMKLLTNYVVNVFLCPFGPLSLINYVSKYDNDQAFGLRL